MLTVEKMFVSLLKAWKVSGISYLSFDAYFSAKILPTCYTPAYVMGDNIFFLDSYKKIMIRLVCEGLTSQTRSIVTIWQEISTE